MKLTNFLLSRQHGLSDNIVVENKTILFKDINAVVELEDWKFYDVNKFNEFISKYTFPKNDEFSKKDRDGIRQNIPKPQILIQKTNNDPTDNQPIIAMYLYHKSQLAGDTLMHIRSVNKFEQMWARYFFNYTNAPINNPKVFKKDFFEFCQSSDILFNYNLIGTDLTNSARLRILSFSFNQLVLLMYVFDKSANELGQEEIQSLVDNIKSST